MPPTSNSQKDSQEHDKFVELCALYSSDSLSEAEFKELGAHLSGCVECQGLLVDYHSLIQDGIPLLADADSLEETTGFDRDLANSKKRLFAKLADSEQHLHAEATSRRKVLWIDWQWLRSPAVKYAVLALLAGCLSAGAYRVGMRKSVGAATMEGQRHRTLTLSGQLSDIMRERDSLQLVIAQRDRRLRTAFADLHRQQEESAKLQQLLNEATAAGSHDASIVTSLRAEDASLQVEHEKLLRRLEESQSALSKANAQADQKEAGLVASQVEATAKDEKLDELNAEVSEQQRLLTADRDIRELMGARDLLIADVFDIDPNGRNRKPFGRVFYTKNKSLIFYAFDLDRQPGLHNASTFQAWGASATQASKAHPVSLGVFYLDNQAARRWVLRFEDPKVLAQIDSVFVTVEPNGGSHTPSGKQLLFAYLRGAVNHP